MCNANKETITGVERTAKCHRRNQQTPNPNKQTHATRKYAPRAATIICESENAVLFALDRQTFNHIVKDAAVKKRERYEGK